MKLKHIVLGILLISSIQFAYSAAGTGSSGGGDLCEDRIKVIRDDLADWIKKGGPKDLSLPTDISGYHYSEAMLEQIDHSKIKCVSEGDEGFPVNINGVAKVCRFDANKNEGQITCDYNKFQSIKDSDQYVLIHHEFAGLAGIENPNGPDSDYSISNQISGYLVNQVVKKLSIKRNDTSKEDCIKFDPTNLKIIYRSDITTLQLWSIVESLPENVIHLMSTFKTQDQAIEALKLITDNGFTEHCFVGRPNPSFEYWR